MDRTPDQIEPLAPQPKLRLVGGCRTNTPTARRGPLAPPRPAPASARPTHIGSREAKPRGNAASAVVSAPLPAGDPRWVLAVRVSESLQGATLPPERRRRLIKMGRVFGLTEFDTNLIIAIVQDQARRGHRPEICPRMGEPQLRMVPAPAARGPHVGRRRHRDLDRST